MIEQIKKIAEQVEENESKKLLLESEITHLEEVLKHGISSRFVEENAIYVYSPKMGHEIRKKLEEDYKLMHPKLSMPKKIAEELDKLEFDWDMMAFPNSPQGDYQDLFDYIDRGNAPIIMTYLAGKALGVELVEVEG